MELNLKILSHCFLRPYKDCIGEFGHNSQKLSELLMDMIVKFDTVARLLNHVHPLRARCNVSVV
jgi:hypothetical protein